MLCNISQNAMGQPPGGGGYPARSSLEGGHPARGGTLLGGYPAGGGYPGQVTPRPGQDGGYPGGGGTQVRYPPRPGQDGGGYPVRTT